jgi:uncharacterized membrane protein YcaP (DUF421 family)
MQECDMPRGDKSSYSGKQNDKLLSGALLRYGISHAAFERELRAHEFRSLHDVEEARLESTGRITFLKAVIRNREVRRDHCL